MSLSPKFSIVTPCFNQLGFLQRAVASVADQKDVTFEHIIQNGGSDSETVTWLDRQQNLRVFHEKDAGMYDGLNRGFAKATGEICAWLNCDEQYLPETLSRVYRFMAQHPEVEILYGDSLVVNPDGKFLAFRKTAQLWPSQFAPIPLGVMSCSLFFRRKTWQNSGGFDCKLKSIGDHDWLLSLVQKGCSYRHIRDYLGVYTHTGSNLSMDTASRSESELWSREHVGSYGMRAKVALASRYLLKWWMGCYSSSSIEYAIYTKENSQLRTAFQVDRPSWNWPKS
jgi:glycosyltransferase involved in cell wall biosynthesis